jgi:hypothetical protein
MGRHITLKALNRQTKEQAALKFQEFYSCLLETDIKVFIDRLKLPNRITGAGFVLY